MPAVLAANVKRSDTAQQLPPDEGGVVKYSFDGSWLTPIEELIEAPARLLLEF